MNDYPNVKEPEENSFAKSWNKSLAEKGTIVEGKVMKIFFGGFAIFFVFAALIYLSKRNWSLMGYEEIMMFIVASSICSYLALSLPKISLIQYDMMVQNQGWYDNNRVSSLFFKHITYALLIMSISVTLIVLLKININDNIILSLIVWIVTVVTFYFTKYIESSPPHFSRRFVVPTNQAIELLETRIQAILISPESKRIRDILLISDINKTEIMAGPSKSGYFAVHIGTPRGQEERNRQLREAVAAVLEGRSPVSSRAAGPAAEGRA